MDRDARNISTDHQPKGSAKNPSDTLDRPEAADAHVGDKTLASPAKPGRGDVVDEKGRPLNGDGTTDRAAGI
jgi:hypothetical protein